MGRSLGSASASEIIFNQKCDIDGCIIESGFGTESPLMNILGINPEEIGYKTKHGFENLKKSQAMMDHYLSFMQIKTISYL